jgi:hypothetical protein
MSSLSVFVWLVKKRLHRVDVYHQTLNNTFVLAETKRPEWVGSRHSSEMSDFSHSGVTELPEKDIPRILVYFRVAAIVAVHLSWIAPMLDAP